jgi:hypothetical protein
LSLGVAVAVLAFAGPAWANIQSSGDIAPVVNPLDATTQGLPTLGNFLDISLAANADAQTFFEGITDQSGARTSKNFNVLVGPSHFGQLLISGNTQLRQGTLIIGGIVLNSNGGDTAQGFTADPLHTHGTGFVRITDPGSLYNNDPSILPFGLPASFSTYRTPDQNGFDLYVGRTGAGTLQIDTGGAAEIQDSIVVGDQSGATGTIIVDGSSSFLGNSGNLPVSGDPSDPGMMVIGRRGSGTMSVTNGAQVIANAPQTTGSNTTLVAAAIGSDPTTTSVPQTQAGGLGNVTVDGVGTKWAISGGSLQVGGFDSIGINTGPGTADVAGNNLLQSNQSTDYVSNAGHGTLNVNNGAVVAINLQGPNSQSAMPLDMLIGQYGTINLNGGSIEVNNQLSNDPINPIQELQFVRTINDGLITGSGTITTGQFDNRSLGRIRVNAGQTLLINSTSQFTANDLATPFRETMQNYGLIEVLGTDQARAELEFQRSSPAPIGGTPDLPRPFINFQQTTAPTNGGRQVGAIIAQSATLRFDSGLQNQSFLVFNAGTNIVTGNIVNCSNAVGNPDACTLSLSPGAVIGQGQILINGPSVATFPQGVTTAGPITNVTFENAVTGGGAVITTGVVNVTHKDSPTISGLYQVNAGGSVTVFGDLTLSNGADVQVAIGASFNVTGNLIFDTGLVKLSPIITSTTGLHAGDLFPILTYGGQILPPSTSFTTIPLDLGNGLTIIPLDPATTPHLIEVKVTSSAALPMNDADLDGNGIVDANDLAIWRTRYGLTGLGDVNGDGRVDLADYTIIRDHFGLAMGAGAGAGSSATVPEPASVMLAFMGSVLAAAMISKRRMHERAGQ